jgi:serine/threonine protein kinase
MTIKTIGRYEIREELGRGGMGTVYLAYDSSLDREVAVKVLPSYFAEDPDFSARFTREARALAGLDHQAIVAVYDFGQHGSWPYFVMRYMLGGSLKERMSRGPMDLEEVGQVIDRIAGALDKAHENGIIHRDVKPANILFDEEGEAYLSDFGLVKLAQKSDSFTRTGQTLGTPVYMSPEQADNLPDVDGRSDIYSLGVVLYEMLTGQAPYTHDSVTRLLMMHLTAPIPKLADARPGLPASLQDVIDRALAKDRADRYATAGEMSSALQQATRAAVLLPPATEPSPTTKPPTGATIEPATQQPDATPQPLTPAESSSIAIPKWILALGGLVALALLAGAIAIILALADDPDDSRPTAVVDQQTPEQPTASVATTSVADSAAISATQTAVASETAVAVTATRMALENSDSDGDGLTYLQEIATYLTDPAVYDTDEDGLSDGEEVLEYGTDPTRYDTDDDGLNDEEEINDHSTDPTRYDSDDDGLSDGDEVNVYSTDPEDADSDNDGLEDGDEIANGADANRRDTDGDGVSDGDEVARESNPNIANITFTHFPDGSPINVDTILNGDEFADWGILLAAAPVSSYCDDGLPAVLHNVDGIRANALTTASPGDPGRCNTIPNSITFIEPVQEVGLVFAGAEVLYELQVYDDADTLIATIPVTPAEVFYSGETFEVRYRSPAADIKRIVFGEEFAGTYIVEIIYQ